MRLTHTYRPSGHTSASGAPQDSCLRCGRTKQAHESPVRLTWGGQERRFATVEEAREAGFYVATKETK